MSVVQELHKVMEDLIYLCEIRGELDKDSNDRIENKIRKLEQRYKELQKEMLCLEK